MKKLALFSLVLTAAFVALLLDAGSEIGIAVLAATPTTGGYWNDGMHTFRRNLGKTVGKISWFKGKMTKYMAMINVDKYKPAGAYSAAKNSPNPINSAIIHVVMDFKKVGGVHMDIPLTRPLTAQGVVGTSRLRGNVEKRTIFTKKVSVNLVRHGVQIQDNDMSGQTMTRAIRLSLLERGGNDLKDWFTRKLAFQPFFAALTGYSDNLTDSSYGIGKTQKSHPNTFVQGLSAQPKFHNANGTYSHVAYTFDAGWESWIANALSSLTDTSSDHFKLQSIRNMVYLARQLKIMPIVKSGVEVFLIFVTSAHMRQLRSDPDWVSYHKEAALRGDKNQLFTGVTEGYIIEGAVMIVDDTIPAARISGDSDTSVYGEAYTSARGTINYGRSEYMLNPRDISPRKAALLFGIGAISAANPGEFILTSEEDDHGQIIEDGGKMMYGFERCDIIDDDGYIRDAGLLLENSSSLAYWTYTPDEISLV